MRADPSESGSRARIALINVSLRTGVKVWLRQGWVEGKDGLWYPPPEDNQDDGPEVGESMMTYQRPTDGEDRDGKDKK